MKTASRAEDLLNPSAAAATLSRLAVLTPQSRRHWGYRHTTTTSSSFAFSGTEAICGATRWRLPPELVDVPLLENRIVHPDLDRPA